jgi:AcrR family transcriptional regulator
MTLYRQFGRKDELIAAALQQWSAHWLRWMRAELDRRSGVPGSAFAVLWETLEGWFAAESFSGSFATNAATELRSEPNHPAQKVIAEHRMAMQQILTDLAGLTEAHDPVDLATTLQVLIDGAITMAMVDRRLAIAPGVRTLADAWSVHRLGAEA